jgi:hypothetical protein
MPYTTPILRWNDTEVRDLLMAVDALEFVCVVYFFGLDRGRARRTLAETARIVGKAPGTVRQRLDTFAARPLKSTETHSVFDFAQMAQAKLEKIADKTPKNRR